ncbi:MAG: hypothetical protein WAS07_14225 [Micropruina sp.]
MNIDHRGLSRFEHDELRDLVLAGTQRIRPSSRRGLLAGAGVALLLVGALVGGMFTWALIANRPPAPVTGVPAPKTTVWSGWVAFAAGEQDGDIYLVKQGSAARRILGSDKDTADQACPAFSPDGGRLVSGQVTDDGSGGEKAALVITKLAADGEPTDTVTIALDGVFNMPCAIWSADSRWLAFGAQVSEPEGVGEVWVVDTFTNDIRRRTADNQGVTDLEWAPNASELYMANLGITVYSATSEKTHTVPGTLGAVALAVSPDGQSLAVQYAGSGTGVAAELWLMGTDGSDRRNLVSGYTTNFGIGPVWSPQGNQVAFQRLCDTYTDDSGRARTCLEEHEVVLVTVKDGDPGGPFGTQKVIAPPKPTLGGKSSPWFPYSVSWAPDNLTLLYVAWGPSGTGILAVPMDSATPPSLLADALNGARYRRDPWNTFQSWSKKP